MITAMSSRLIEADGKLIVIGFNGNSDLGFLAITMFGLDCCSFCCFSRAASFLRSSSASRFDAFSSVEDIVDLGFVKVFVLGLEAMTVLLLLPTPQSKPRRLASRKYSEFEFQKLRHPSGLQINAE